MPKWRVPVWYTKAGFLEVEADSAEEAIEEAQDDKYGTTDVLDAEYVDDSWRVEEDPDNVEEEP